VWRSPPSQARSISADAVFLVNPASGNGATGRRWSTLARAAAAAGLKGEAWFSDGAGAVADLAQRAGEISAPLVVVVGGDGTIHDAVNGLMRLERSRRPDLAVVPVGSGDDYAHALRIPADPRTAFNVALRGRPRELDLGRAECQTPTGPLTRYFASMAGTGMSGAVAERLNRTTKVLGGRVSGLLATLVEFVRWRNVELTVDIDGESRTGLMEDVLVGNTEYHNGGMRLCPGALPDDGLLDVLLLGDVSKRDLALALPKLYRGTYLPHPRAELIRGRRVTVESATPLPVELDGEQPGSTPVRFDVVPRALRVRSPG
jgi:diacylglycerol kinase (ATP)